MDYLKEYREQRPTYEALSIRLQSLLEDIARDVGIDIHVIESRTKTLESFENKISRPGKNYHNPLVEITDLSGLRAVLYYQEDVELFSKAIKANFNVNNKQSTDKRLELKSDQFGYISVHLICQINHDRASLFEWKKFKKMNFEIQIRTVLQHAWASISHSLHYKSLLENQDEFTRKLSRIAGLLELSDEQFSDLRRRKAIIKSEVSESIATKHLDIAVNPISIEQFISASGTVKEISKGAKKAGFTVTNTYTLQQLSAIAQGLSISTLDELNNYLNEFCPLSELFFQDFARQAVSDGTPLVDITGDHEHWSSIALVCMLRQEKDMSFIVDTDIWGKAYLDDVLITAGRVFP